MADLLNSQKEGLRDMLNNHLFVRASDLLTRIVAASKGKDGKLFWITLDREYQSTLVETTLAIATKLGVTYPIGLFNKALFTLHSQ